MRITGCGILNPAQPGTRRAAATFPNVTALPDSSLLASYRVGSTKDCSDETIELRRSLDFGETWTEPLSPFNAIIEKRYGSLKCVYITRLAEDHLLGCGLWVDREAYPGQPLFHPETEGCLPMAIVLSDSHDFGRTWSPLRTVPVTKDLGPPSLTSPVLQLSNGELAISIETNKNYLDRSKWYQRVVYLFSRDEGMTWSAPYTVSQDPEGRVYYWDQRAAVAPDGRVVTFSWTYDRVLKTYLTIQRRISCDAGRSWSAPFDLGFTDQPSRPALLPDGRVVLAWVDRYGTRSIRARVADTLEAAFEPRTEIMIHTPESQRSGSLGGVGELLAEMGLWTYGLPYLEPLPNGEVMVVYYAGNEVGLDIRWARLSID